MFSSGAGRAMTCEQKAAEAEPSPRLRSNEEDKPKRPVHFEGRIVPPALVKVNY